MKKLLIVSDTPTHPVSGGNRACILQNVDLLRNMGFDIYFLYVHNYDAPEADIDETRSHWGDRFLFYRVPTAQHLYRRVMARIYPAACAGIDFLFPWGLNKYVEKVQRQHNFTALLVNYVWMSRLYRTSIPHKALYTHDVFSNRAERVNIKNYAWRTFTVAQEAKGIRRFDNVLAIQSNEAIYFRYLSPGSRVRTVYSPVEFNRQPLMLNHNILFFSGAGDLNISGLDWFVKEVFPIILEKMPQARLVIGGDICKSLAGRYTNPNIQLVGRVENPADFYKLGDIVINPVFQGTGLKIKTLEAISYGKYIVAQPHSVEGMFSGSEQPYDVAHQPIDFAEKIITAITNERILSHRVNISHDYIQAYNKYIRNIYEEIFPN